MNTLLKWRLAALWALGLAGAAGVAAQPAMPTPAVISFAAGLPCPGAPDTLEAVVAGAATSTAIPLPFMPPIKNGTAPTISLQPISQTATTGAAVTFTVTASGTPAPFYQWMKNGRFIRGANASTYKISAVAVTDAGAYMVEVYNGVGFASSQPALLSVANSGTAVVPPVSLSIATGATASFTVTAAGSGLTYQWSFDGLAISGATAATYQLANAGPGASGTFSVGVSSGSTVVAEEVATLQVATNARLTNLSTRGMVGTGDQVLIVGFVTNGTGNKQILLRGVGPTLATEFNLSGTLATPQLTLTGGGKTIATNAGWGGTSTLSQVFSQVGAFALPAKSADAALLESLAPGGYSAQVSGLNGATGIALAEIYDADVGTPASDLVNISARAYVANGASVLIAGFSVAGPSSETILIRGIGPSLRGMFGFGDALRNTQVTLFDSKGNPITANAGWGNDPWISGTSTQVGAFGLMPGSLDSALLVTIPPGAYSAEVTSTDGTTGIGMVEIYEVR